jgi:hypothetical protein
LDVRSELKKALAYKETTLTNNKQMSDIRCGLQQKNLAEANGVAQVTPLSAGRYVVEVIDVINSR